MSTNPIEPFDPNVPTGYSTNLVAGAAQQVQRAQQEPLLFAGWGPSTTGFAPTSGGKFASETGVPAADAHVFSSRERMMLTPTEFLAAFDQFDREDFLRFRNLFIAAGLVAPGADPGGVRDAYVGIISQVADMSAQGIQMSPMGFVKNLIRMNGFDPSKIGASENFLGEGSEPVTTVQRNVTEITQGQAFASLQNTLSQLLGRDPEDQETRDFLYRMNRLAAENPSISRTVTRYKNGEQVSSTHTDPGFTEADMAQEAYDDAQNDPEYAEYRGASYLFNAVMSALGPIGG